MAFRRPRTKIVSPYTETAADRQRSALELRALSQSIREIRKQRGMTQAELGIAIGTEQAAIARLESGRHAPSFRTLQAIARATRAELDLFYRPLDLTVMEKRTTMTDSRPKIFTDRRQFVGGAMGLAGMLGLGATRRITAEEATAAATGIDTYVWTPPIWDPEPKLLDVIERNDTAFKAQTILDGEVEGPLHPERMVCLSSVYVTLVALGVDSGFAGVSQGLKPGELAKAGMLTSTVHETLAGVTILETGMETPAEPVIALEPDLILGNIYTINDQLQHIFSEVAPTVRTTESYMTPRQEVRDIGAMFGRDDAAKDIVRAFDEFVVRAKQKSDSHLQGKRVAVIFTDGEWISLLPSYRIDPNDDVATPVSSVTLPAYRELGLTPPNYVEKLADDANREAWGFDLSYEQLGMVDADAILVYGKSVGIEQFMNHAGVTATEAGQNNQVFGIATDEGFGQGIYGVREHISRVIEILTGEPFE